MRKILNTAIHRPEVSILGRLVSIGSTLVLLATMGCGVSTFSTDIPVEYHRVLQSKYLGKKAWTRLTLQDEKKAIKIEQDEEVKIIELGLTRTGSVTIETPNGRTRLVHPFALGRPLTLEYYEKALLDALWFDPPETRYEKNKETFGTRIADAIRDHKILKDMSQRAAYLAWGAPENIIAIRRGMDERWEYDTLNLKKAKIEFRSGKVVQWDGENVGDTEAEKKRRRFRRTS